MIGDIPWCLLVLNASNMLQRLSTICTPNDKIAIDIITLCCRPVCVRICPPECAPGQARWRLAGGSICFALSLFLGGGLVEDHHDMMLGLVEDHHDMMLAERIALLKKNIAVSGVLFFCVSMILYLW